MLSPPLYLIHYGNDRDALEAEVGGVLIIPHEVAMEGRGGAEGDVGAEVVAARLAELAVAARHARLDRYAVAHFQVFHFGTNLKIKDVLIRQQINYFFFKSSLIGFLEMYMVREYMFYNT